MSYNPKTPSRHRARSDTKTPLTGSVVPGQNGYSLNTSPTKGRADLTNPFISSAKLGSGSGSGSKSRQNSPTKRATTGSIEVTERLRRQASLGLIRKGAVESRLDVVTRDYVPPPKKEIKRSKSQPAVSCMPSQRSRTIYIVATERYSRPFYYHTRYSCGRSCGFARHDESQQRTLLSRTYRAACSSCWSPYQ